MADPEKSPGYSNRLKDDYLSNRKTSLQGPGKEVIRRHPVIPNSYLKQYHN